VVETEALEVPAEAGEVEVAVGAAAVEAGEEAAAVDSEVAGLVAAADFAAEASAGKLSPGFIRNH